MKDTTTLKGMNFNSVSKKTILKKGFGRGLEKIYNLTEIKNEISDVINSKGKVYYCTKFDKQSKAKDTLMIFIFKKTGTAKEKNITFTLDKIYTNPEYDKKIYQKYMTRNCITMFEDTLTFEDTQKVIIGDTILEKNYFKAGSFAISGAVIGLGIGVVFGLLFHNLALGICFGISFMSLFSITLSSASGSDSIQKKKSEIDVEKLFKEFNIVPLSIESAKEDNLKIID